MAHSNNTLTNTGIGRATIVIAVFSLLAKVSGLVRDAIFSHEFGTSKILDAYFAAFRIPDFVFNILILGTITVAFVPVFSQYLLKDQKAANSLASSILNATIIGTGFLSLIAFIFIAPLTRIIAPGFDTETAILAESFSKILLLSPILLSATSVTGSMLNVYKRFMLVSAVPAVYNLSIIFGALVLYPKFGPVGLVWGVVLGAFLYLVIPLPQLFRLGFKYSPQIDYKSPGFIKFWKLYWPRIFSMGTSQVTLLIASIFGSFLAAGSLSAFYYANNLQSVFLSLFAISASIAVFPLLSDLYNQKDETGFKDVLAKTTIQILFFIVPLSALMIILRAQIVRLVLGIGENTNFSFADTRAVALTLGLFAFSLFAQGLIPLFSRAFYAMQNTVIPVMIGIVTIVVNVIATYFFTKAYGMPGMALAFSITSIINLLLLLIVLHRSLGNIHDEYVITNSLKIIIASFVGGLASFIMLYIVAPHVNMATYGGVLIQATISGAVGCATYLAIGWLIGISESKDLIKLGRSMFIKFTKPFNILWNIWE